MNICIDCGSDYFYDPSKPLGASSERCPSCRKKDSEKNKKIILFNIASAGTVAMCRKCGYKNSPSAFVLMNAVALLGKPPDSFEEKKKQAERQFIVCLNCKAEIDSNEVEYKVTDSKSRPVKVEFYSRKVQIVREKIDPIVEFSSDAVEAEVVTDDPFNDIKRAKIPTMKMIK